MADHIRNKELSNNLDKLLEEIKAGSAPKAQYNPQRVRTPSQFERDFDQRMQAEQLARQNAVKRGVSSWVPEIPGFAADLLVDAPYNLVQRAAGKRGDNIKPLGFGEDVRRGVSQALGMAPASLGEAGMSMPPDETNEAVTTALQFANPLMLGAAGNPVAIARATGKGAKALAPTAAKFAEDYLMRTGQILPVIKPSGGNWLPEGTKALEGLKPHRYAADDKKMFEAELADLMEQEARTPGRHAARIPVVQGSIAEMDRNIEFNNWIDKQLTRYVKNEMATPKDSIRELAEKGRLHYEPRNLQLSEVLDDKREEFAAANNGRWGYGESPLAQRWEDASDKIINKLPAGRYQKQQYNRFDMTKEPGWEFLDKVSPETPLYGVNNPSSVFNEGSIDSLGFPHLIDELRNATNPASGLPRELLLKPESLSRLSVPQAVERVAKINEWRANQIKNARLENMLKADVHKEYPEKGMRWVQLNKPGQFAEESDLMGHSVRGYEPQEGGGSSGYGLGGYPAIESGEAKVYSLRDAKGEPHATIEVGMKKEHPRHNQIPDDVSEKLQAEGKRIGNQKADAAGHGEWSGERELEQRIATSELKDNWAYDNPITSNRITQIKGKSNKAPNEEYLPYVQDFVRSGKWGDVGDLQNTGLYRKSDFIDEFTSDQLDSIGMGEYLNINEIKGLREGKPWKPIDQDPELDIDPNILPPMKRGGPVNQDAMQMAVWNKAIRKAGGGRMNAAEMALKLIKKGAKALDVSNELKSAARTAAGVPDLPPTIKTGVKAGLTKPQSILASKALDQFIGEKLALTPSVADRMVARPGRSREKGGPMFPWLSTVDPEYEGWVWANKGKGKSTQMIRMAEENPGLIFTPQFGDAEMHRSNQVTFERLLRAFNRAKEEGKLTPELEAAYNKRLTSFYKDVEGGKPLFSPEFSIGDLKPSEAELMSFPARAAIAEVLGGKGLRDYGYKRQEAAQIIPYKRILENMTEPSLIDAPSGSVGPRLFTLSGERVTDPSIHAAYPEIVGGKDLGVQYEVAPRDVIAHEFVKKIQESKGRPPGHMDWDRNSVIMPIDMEMILRLQDAGKKKGGRVQKKAAGGLTSDDLVLEERKL